MRDISFFTRDWEKKNKNYFHSVEIGNDIRISVKIKKVFFGSLIKATVYLLIFRQTRESYFTDGVLFHLRIKSGGVLIHRRIRTWGVLILRNTGKVQFLFFRRFLLVLTKFSFREEDSALGLKSQLLCTSLLLIITLRFTYNESKICSTIKKS